MPLVAIGVLGAVGSIAGGAIASHGASQAAKAGASAADNAAQLEHQDAQSALNFQEGQYGNSQRELSPYANIGYSSIANLANLMGILPGGGTTAKPVSSSVTGTVSPSNSFALSTGGTNGDGIASPGQRYQNPIISQPGAKVSSNYGPPDGTNFGPRGGTGISSGTLALNTGANNGGAGTPEQFGINVPSNLQNLVNTRLGAPGSLLQPFSGLTMENDPGYQFRLNQGNQQINNSAAARGELLSGNTLEALSKFGQDYASNEYTNAYNRYNNDQTTTFNRLAALAGMGQSSTNQLIDNGASTANGISNTLLQSGAQISNNINNAGAARASGYASAGNIAGSTVGGLSNNISNLLLLKQLTRPTTSGDQSAFDSGYYG